MLPEYRAFWIRGDDGLEYGPVPMGELREWARENRAGLGTDVRTDEPNAPWQPWQYYPELVAMLAEVRVTSPVPGQPGLVIASIGRRFLAFGVDLILVYFLMLPIFAVLAFLFLPDFCVQMGLASMDPKFAVPELSVHERLTGTLIFYLVLVLYVAGFHAAHGRTPGKSMLRIRVVDENGRKPTLTRSLLRGVILIFSISLYGLPFIYIFINPERRAFHDFLAGTYVVRS